MEPLVVYDTETTGLKTKLGHRPLTLGMVALNDDLTIKAILSIPVWDESWAANVDAKAMEINKIDLVEHRKVAISPVEAIARVTAFFQENFGKVRPTLVGQNEQFDFDMVSTLFQDAGSDFSKIVHYHHVDTCQIYRLLQSARALPLLAERRTPDAYRNAKLATIVAAYGVEHDTSAMHNALVDALLTHKVYVAMVNSLTPVWRKAYNRLTETIKSWQPASTHAKN